MPKAEGSARPRTRCDMNKSVESPCESSFSLTSRGSGWKSWICTGAAMQPLTTHGTVLKHQFIQDMDSFVRIPNTQLGIQREMKNPHIYLLGWCDTAFIGFDLLERSFKTQSKFQNSKTSIMSLLAWLRQTSLLSTWITNHTHSTAG